MPTKAHQYLAPPFLDYNVATIQAFIARFVPPNVHDKRAQAIALYYGVRDHIRYDVYDAAMDAVGLRTSSMAALTTGHSSGCVQACANITRRCLMPTVSVTGRIH